MPSPKIQRVVVAVGIATAALLAVVACSSASKPRASIAPDSSDPATTATGTPVTPADATATLQAISVTPSDAPQGTVMLLPGGDQVTNEVSLDVCGRDFPSEQLRAARRQTGVATAAGVHILSTEALKYESPAASAQAMGEMRAAEEQCPAGYLPSPVAGVPDLKYVFAPAPDTAWPATAGVDRFAIAFTASSQDGKSETISEVMIRRGSVVDLLYFYAPGDPSFQVAGQSTPQGIVGVFESRLAALPAAEVA